MDITPLLFYTFLTVSFYLIYKLLSPGRYRLPPSPGTALPLLGHLHLLDSPLHRTFLRLSKKTGPIFSLKLGFRRIVVVSSSTLVEECFTNRNDIIFANRPRSVMDKYLAYDHSTVAGGDYGDHWKSLRRVAAVELLSNARLSSFLHIRQDEVKRLLLNVYEDSSGPGYSKVELKPKLSELTFNVMMRTITGRRLSGLEQRKVINKTFELAEASNPQDFLIFLQWFDYGGFKKEVAALGEKLDQFFQELVDENRREKRTDSMIGHLLSLQESQPDFYNDFTIKGLILSLLLAGTDTSTVTVEWAMSVLLNHPDVLNKAREELNAQVGFERLIEEEDLSNLPFLQNIISETYRLFPPAPLLIPHQSSQNCRVGGYDIRRGTMLFVNAWAIHRDPELWEEPERFKPERFERKEVEKYKLIPFGMGRRGCPGIGLAQRVVGLALGSLIQCFDWERVSQDEVDLSEGIGLTMPKMMPLEAMCKPRDIMLKVVGEESLM
uniref:(+)-piperitol/(+)-sesamin synthase n=1 Tax=Scoparia dulcis TaxID=107240 RepID=A0A1W7HBR3_SCODU